MRNRNRSYIYAVILTYLAAGITFTSQAGTIDLSRDRGPFVDWIVFEVITQEDQADLVL